MEIYTIVDEGYEVEVFTSFDALWNRVSHCEWMDRYEPIALTKESLKSALNNGQESKLYEADAGDEWAIKVKKHAA